MHEDLEKKRLECEQLRANFDRKLREHLLRLRPQFQQALDAYRERLLRALERSGVAPGVAEGLAQEAESDVRKAQQQGRGQGQGEGSSMTGPTGSNSSENKREPGFSEVVPIDFLFGEVCDWSVASPRTPSGAGRGDGVVGDGVEEVSMVVDDDEEGEGVDEAHARNMSHRESQ